MIGGSSSVIVLLDLLNDLIFREFDDSGSLPSVRILKCLSDSSVRSISVSKVRISFAKGMLINLLLLIVGELGFLIYIIRGFALIVFFDSLNSFAASRRFFGFVGFFRFVLLISFFLKIVTIDMSYLIVVVVFDILFRRFDLYFS